MSDKKEVAEEKKKTNTVYARFPGCKGDVRAKGYDECIEFDSFQFGAGLGVGSGRRWRGDDDDDAEDEEVGEDDFPERECSEPSLSEVTLTKAQDSVSAIFFYNLCAKKDYGTIVLDLVDIKDDKTPVPTMRMVLKHTIMSGYSTSWGEGSRKSHESVSLNFAAVEVITFVDGVPNAGAGYHMPSNTSTFMSGSNLDVTEKVKPKKKEKKNVPKGGKDEEEKEEKKAENDTETEAKEAKDEKSVE